MMREVKFLFYSFLFPYVLFAQCGNIDFELGNPSGWNNAAYGWNSCDSLNSPNPMQTAGFNFTAYNITTDMHGMCTGGVDPSITTFNLSLPCAGCGNFTERLGDTYDNCSSSTMSFNLAVSPPCMNVAFYYAVVLFDNHPANDSPKFMYGLRNLTSGALLDTGYFDSNSISTDTAFHPADPNIPGLYYKGWTKVCYNLAPYLGMNVQFTFVTSDCDSGTHRGYSYLDFNMNSCSGSTEVSNFQTINYYADLVPNPATNQFNLSLKNLENDELAITLMNVQGSILLTDNFISGPGQISRTYKTEDLPKGMYFVNIKTKNQGAIQRKLIIN